MPKLPIKERSTWVGILRHDKLDPEEIGEETDFVWLKCHGVSALSCWNRHI